MERILGYPRKGGLWLGMILAIIAGIVSFEGSAYAEIYQGWWTGYAMGNITGAANVVLDLGHVARHRASNCPNDPAAYWDYRTVIYLLGGISLQNCDGTTSSYSLFTIQDWGDSDCSEGDYWIDVYFGRCKKPADPCSCPGVNIPAGSCDSFNTVNSCTNARNFGKNFMLYDGPAAPVVWCP